MISLRYHLDTLTPRVLQIFNSYVSNFYLYLVIAGHTAQFLMENWQQILKLADVELLLSDRLIHNHKNTKQEIELRAISFLNLVIEYIRWITRNVDCRSEKIHIFVKNLKGSPILEFLNTHFIHHLILRRTLDICIEIFSYYNVNLLKQSSNENLDLIDVAVNCLTHVIDNRETLSSKYVMAMQNISLFSGIYYPVIEQQEVEFKDPVINDYACSSGLIRKLILCLFASLRIVLLNEFSSNRSVGMRYS